MSTKLKRPPMRYHGGKWRLAPWIISHFPEHRVYVEAFGGAASVLLQKPRTHTDIYNDRWDEVVNLFEVLRDEEMAAEVKRVCELTPFARTEMLIGMNKNMRQRDFEPCAVCHKGVMHGGSIMFYRVRVDHLGVNPRAVQEVHGLELMLGAAAPAAQNLGTDPDIGIQIATTTLIVCSDCMLGGTGCDLLFACEKRASEDGA